MKICIPLLWRAGLGVHQALETNRRLEHVRSRARQEKILLEARTEEVE